jgi:uncharacterized membrane protein YgdD (TMEM256/DUF423 family)
MTKVNVNLLAGAVLGLTSVMLAAYADHSWVAQLPASSLKSVLTAIKYQQYYALLIVALGITAVNGRRQTWLTAAAGIFMLGILLFCSGIYGSILLGLPGIIYLTPFGGMTLMAGWAALMGAAFQKQKGVVAQINK